VPKVCLRIDKLRAGTIPAKCIVTGSTEDLVWETFTFKRSRERPQDVALRVLHVPHIAVSTEFTVTVALPFTRAAHRAWKYSREIAVLDFVLFLALAFGALWVATAMDRWPIVGFVAFVPVFVVPFAIYMKWIMDSGPECPWSDEKWIKLYVPSNATALELWNRFGDPTVPPEP